MPLPAPRCVRPDGIPSNAAILNHLQTRRRASFAKRSLHNQMRTVWTRIADRGEIRPGAFADIVIFNPARVVDRATYSKPHELAEGIDWVIVNGQVERNEGEFTGARGGRVLRK